MRATLRILVPVAVLAFAALLPLWSGTYILAVARSVLTYMALAISWDMLLRSGQISFGIAGFFGLGAYAAALGVLRAGMTPLESIFFAGAFAGAVALVLGFVILRLRAVYFSITTLALAAIFQVIAHNSHEWSGGPEGLVMPGLIFGGEAKALYWVILAAVALAAVASEAFERSRLRLALTAIRNNEVSAASSGIHIFKYLVIAFVVSSFLQGIVGGIQVQGYGFASPDSAFDANYTLLPLAIALLGGMHSTAGPVIGGLLLGIAAEFLKLKIPYGHYLVYGVIILLVILFMPQGLWGLLRGRRRAPLGRKALPPRSPSAGGH
jgi:branched-chain amino acid transport system permease protein